MFNRKGTYERWALQSIQTVTPYPPVAVPTTLDLTSAQSGAAPGSVLAIGALKLNPGPVQENTIPPAISAAVVVILFVGQRLLWEARGDGVSACVISTDTFAIPVRKNYGFRPQT